MNRSLLTAGLASVAAVSLALCLADDLTLAPREGVVLLHNGELIAGRIVPAGDRYDVHLEAGEISLKRSDVAMVCRDAAECYQHKRAGIEQGRAQDHLQLAEWCIRNGLLAAGERELAAAKAADPRHPRIRLVESRLALAQQPPPQPAATSAARPVAHAPLDNIARNLPPGSMETFTNTIQPLLLNNCSRGGCHAGRGAGGLHLERIHPKLSGRSTTQRNLQRVLALVDRDDPAQSALLQAPIRPHGPVKAPIFTDRQQSQYRQLVQWTYVVAGARLPVSPPTIEERTAPLLQTMPGRGGGVIEPGDAGGEHPLPDELPLEGGLQADGSPAPLSAAEQAYTPDQVRAMGIDPFAGGTASRVQRGAQPSSGFVPKDEFDPEIFNRRFFSR